MATPVGGILIELNANAALLVQELSKASAATLAASQKMQASLNQAAAGFTKLDTSVSRVGRGISSFTSIARNVQSSLALIGVGLGVKAIIDYADAWRLAENQLKLVTGSTEQASIVHKRLFDIAQNLGVSVDSLTTIYTRTARSADTLGVTQAQTLKITEALGAAIKVSGANSVEAAGALIQLSQAFARGNLQGQELRTISTQLPVVLDAVAAATGKTRAEVLAFGTQGGIAADLVAKAILRAGTTWQDQADAMALTFGQAIARVQNSLSLLLGTSAISGAFNPLIDAIGKLADALADPAVGKSLQKLLADFTDVATFIVSTLVPALTSTSNPLQKLVEDANAAGLAVRKIITHVAAGASLGDELQKAMLTGDPAADLEITNKQIETAMQRRKALLDQGATDADIAVQKQSEFIALLQARAIDLTTKVAVRVDLSPDDLRAIQAAQKQVDDLANTVASLTAAGDFSIKFDIATDDLATAKKKLQELEDAARAAQARQTGQPSTSFQQAHPGREAGLLPPPPPLELRHGVGGPGTGVDTANKIAAARRAIAELATSSDELGKIEDDLNKKSEELGRVYQQFAKVITDPTERARAMGRVLQALAVSEEEGAAKRRQIAESFVEEGRAAGLTADILQRMGGVENAPLREAVTAFGRLSEAAGTLDANQASLEASTRANAAAYAEEVKQINASALSIDQRTEALKRAQGIALTIQAKTEEKAARASVPEPTDAEKAKLAETRARQSRIESGSRLPDDIDTANIAASNLASTLSDIQNLSFESLSQSFQQIAQQIAQAVIQALIFKAIMAATSGIGPSPAGPGGGAFAAGAAGGGSGGGIFGGGKAEGGSISAGVTYAVGEVGTEAFVARAPSRIAAEVAIAAGSQVAAVPAHGVLAQAAPVRGAGAEFYQIASDKAPAKAQAAAYLVGESGVHLFRSSVPGQIVPHHRLEAIASAAQPARNRADDRVTPAHISLQIQTSASHSIEGGLALPSLALREFGAPALPTVKSPRGSSEASLEVAAPPISERVPIGFSRSFEAAAQRGAVGLQRDGLSGQLHGLTLSQNRDATYSVDNVTDHFAVTTRERSDRVERVHEDHFASVVRDFAGLAIDHERVAQQAHAVHDLDARSVRVDDERPFQHPFGHQVLPEESVFKDRGREAVVARAAVLGYPGQVAASAKLDDEDKRRRLPGFVRSLTPIMGRAGGGTIHPGHAYEVGEQGRELLIKGDGAAQIIGASGREIMIAPSQAVVIPHAQTEAILSTVSLPGLATGGSTSSSPMDTFSSGITGNIQPNQSTQTQGGDVLQFDLRGMSAGAVADAMNNARQMAQQQIWHDLARNRTTRRSLGLRGSMR